MAPIRFYFANDVYPGGYPTPVFGSSPAASATGASHAPLTTVKHAHAADSGRGTINAPGANPARVVTDVSAPDVLPVGPLSGTWRIVTRTDMGSTANAQPYVRLLVVSGDGTTLRGILFAGQIVTPHGNRISQLDGDLAPVVVQSGDRLVVERAINFGSVGSYSTSGNYYDNHDIALADLSLAQVGTSPGAAAGASWLELYPAVPPNPPTGLTLVDVGTTTASFTFTPPAAGAVPTDYEYRVDGGAAVSTALDVDFALSGLTPATTYTVEVRTVAATGESDWTDPLPFTTDEPADPDPRWWTHKLAAALGLDPIADQPVVEVRTYDHATDTWTVDPDLSNGLTGYTITGGRRTSTARTEPMAATLGFATVRLPATPAVATRLQVALSDAVAAALGITTDQAVRFTGEVTDPAVDHDARRTSLVCVGRLARASRRPVDGTTWPVEDDGERVTRILAAVDAQVGTIDAGEPLLATPERPDLAGRLLDQVTASSLGQVVEQPTGDVDWHDAEHRRDTPIHMTLPASSVFRRVSWSQRLDVLVNDLDVTTATGVLVNVTDTESADPTRYGPWPGSADTILVDALDAYALAIDVVGRRADPSWQLPDLTVDLLRTIPLDDLAAALTIRHATLLELTGLPAGCPVPGEVYVEGWTETATPREWRLQANVSDPLMSGTGIRWIDWPDTDAYQWQDLDSDLTWLDLARITDPTDTL